MKTLKLTATAMTILLTATFANAENSSQRFTASLMDMVDTNFESENYYPRTGNDMFGQLEDSETATHSRYYSQGNHYFVGAVCDEDCTDIDTWVYDKYGNEVASDEDDSDYSLVDFRATYDGPYEIKIKMYNCNASFCYYQMRTYE